MRHRIFVSNIARARTFLFLIAGLAFSICGEGSAKFDLRNHPLSAEWSGPYGGVPQFDAVKVEDFETVLMAAMDSKLAQIDIIAANRAPDTFDNTIAALERSGGALRRARAVYGVWSSNMSSPEFQRVEETMSPRYAAFNDKIIQNARLFSRIEAVRTGKEYSKLTPEQQRLTWHTWNNFVRAGARLGAPEKARLSLINQRLATLFTAFSNNLLKEEERIVTYISKEQLQGLPDAIIKSAGAAAAKRGRIGEYAITNTRSSMEPFLTFSIDRNLREKVWRAYYNRGDNGDQYDNNKLVEEILKLRWERARLLGFSTHAHWRLEVTMAKTPGRALALMESVWPAAIERVAQEVADMHAIADEENAVGAVIDAKIDPWDYRYYAERVRVARYSVDTGEVSKYLQLQKLREGMFWLADQLFGFEFMPAINVPTYHPDVQVWEVKRAGKHVGLWYFDPYARPGKKSGAWMTEYRLQHRVDKDVTTIVSNNANFIKGTLGEPELISWDDALTLFHEFGHALHGLSSNVTYPSLSGTLVVRDFVEFPSQLLERWLFTSELLKRFALHVKTNRPIPDSLVAKIKATATFNKGFDTTEYLSAALVDMKLHLAGDVDIDPDRFERETLAKMHMPREVVMRHRVPQFDHLFSSDGYSAGYYSYLWADTLTADAEEAFEESRGGFYDKDMARKLLDCVFSVGNTVDPADAFRCFRGRDVDTSALMRKRGFLG